MSLAQLHDVLKLAAWHNPHAASDPNSTMKKAVMLTSCSRNCMKHYMEYFLQGIERSRDGDFSQHLVVVANGMSAYLYCDALRHTHKHYCVLDRVCAPPNAAPIFRGEAVGNATTEGPYRNGDPEQPITTIVYWLGLQQRIEWAAAVVDAGYSVLWSDMDIHYFANPLKFFAANAPDADVAFETGYFHEDGGQMFKGAVCKRGPGCVPEGSWASPENGPPGRRFMSAWRAKMFHENIIGGNLFTGSMRFDFVVAIEAFGCNPVPLYVWDPVTNTYEPGGEVTCDAASSELTLYRASAQVFDTWCSGQCGVRDSSGSGVGKEGGQGMDGYYIQADGSHAASPTNATVQKVCAMSKKIADRLVSFHICCNTINADKAEQLRLWLNWTNDEAMYEDGAKNRNRSVYPDW
ncbi:hypothetical protein FOA52_012459 [Chlamydomonas sp. UWO 241]|nr:hypothetical protein FOA52_012459 [Chlamydomonas sp. UWO 241]